MKPLSPDTSPEAAWMQIELLRAQGPGGRVRLALSLSQTVITLARRGQRRRHAQQQAQPAARWLVELHPEEDLARARQRSMQPAADSRPPPAP
jgi:hypothetical protein